MSGPKKILLVEQEEKLRNVLCRWLESSGYQVKSVSDGQEAYGEVELFLPELIVMDALAPKLDGTQLLKKLKGTPFGPPSKILILGDRQKMGEIFDLLGAQGFLPKSVDEEAFLEEVRRILSVQAPVRNHVYKRILIVGRHEECIQRMRKQLDAEGCHTDFVLFGEQVISKAVLFLPNVIIMESRMIDMSSSSIVHILRQMPQFRKVPILIFNYFLPAEIQNSSIQQEELAMSLYVRSCLDEGGTESLGRYHPDLFLERLEKYIKKGSIVAIDDDEGTIRLLKKGLEQNGYKVLAARDGHSGLELIRRANPSLVLLDVVMPGTDGFQLLGILKNDPLLRRIPVIMLTVKNDEADVQTALDLGADDYMIKPFHMNLCLKRIQMILEAGR